MNGQHFLHYRYRLPLSRVDTLGIFGDILVEAVGFLNISVSSLSGNGPCLPLVPGRAQDPPPRCPRQALSHPFYPRWRGSSKLWDTSGMQRVPTEGDPRAMAGR